MFTETHIVGTQGAPTWRHPEADAPRTQQLDPGLVVQVLTSRGDWWHVRCSNGWEAWTDGRCLTPATPHRAQVPSTNRSRRLAAAGGALALAAAFLPWFRGNGVSVNGFDVSFLGLLRGSGSGGPDAGFVMLVSAAIGGLAATSGLPGWVLLLGCAPAGNATGLALFRWAASEGAFRPTVGIGPPVGLIGALLIALAAWPVVFPDVRWRR